jgi:hypothetical protein
MIAGNPCFVGMFRTFDKQGNDISIEWFVFFDEDEAKRTLSAMVEAATNDALVSLSNATMFLPDKAKAN